MSVKRLEIDHKGLPFLDDKGVYVFYEDYAALQEKVAQRDAQIAALTAENVALKSLVADYAKHKTSFDDFDGDRRGIAEHLYEAEQALIAGVETSATDAAANALRAEGLEMLAEQCDGYALNHVYTYTKRHAKEFAKQLREGK